jgi:tRNA A37 methylthiotransferase MiaB
MRILFVCPPDIHAEGFDVATARRRRYLNYPPYGLGLLAAIAEEKGHEAEILNLQSAVLKEAQTAETFDFAAAWQKAIPARKPDLIALTCMFSQTHKSLQAVSEHLASVFPGVTQIAGGVHVTNSLEQEETREKFVSDLPHISRFMRFEAEQEFSAHLDGKKLLQGRLPPTAADLNRRPAWHLMDPRESSRWGKVGAFYFMLGDPVTATVLSNRGCRAHCTFCSVRNFNGEGVRRRNVDAVVDELLLLQNEYGVEHVMWLDDDFLFDRRETMRLFNDMVRRGWRGTWDCSNGVIAASCTEELLSGAVSSGCIGLILGMESGNTSILKEIRKPGTVRHFINAAQNLRRFPTIHSRVFLMIGFPNETLRQMKDTLDVAREMDLDWYNIAPLQALPNTPIYRAARPAVDPTQIRFNSGAYSRAVEKARGGRDLLSADFKHAFDDLDRVPTVAELDTIWAYMNYHLNYARLEHETRPVKLRMQQKYLEHICDAIAPDNAFAMHFSRVVARKLGEPERPEHTHRLREKLKEPYWRARFDDFHLEAA